MFDKEEGEEDNEEDNNNDDKVEIIEKQPPAPSKSVVHDTSCDTCVRQNWECKGVPCHTCDLCNKLKSKCLKSRARRQRHRRK